MQTLLVIVEQHFYTDGKQYWTDVQCDSRFWERYLNVFEKVRGRKKVINVTVDKMVQHAKDGTGYYGKCFIGHFNALDEAAQLKEAVEERFEGIEGGVQIFEIGKTIGAHSGPGTIALFFWGDEKVEAKG